MARSDNSSSTLLANTHLPAAAIVVGALALRIWFVLSMRDHPLFYPLLPGYDMTVFHEWAKRIAAGQLTSAEGFYQGPLYPYLLGALYFFSGPSVLEAALAQAVIGSLSVGLVYLIGNRLWGRNTGLAAAGLMAVTPIFPYYEAILKVETLFMFLNLAFLTSLIHYSGEKPVRRAALAGVLLGLTVLCRANALILLPVGVWTIRSTLKAEGKAGAVRAATAFVLVTLLTISPATLHNRIVAGRWALVSTNFGENWKIGNSYDSTGSFWNPQQALVPVFSSDFLRLQLKKAGLLLSDYEQPNNLNYYQMAEGRPWLELPLLSWGFYLAFGLAGALLTRSRRRKLFPLYAFFLLYGASVVVFFIAGRFRLPLWPVLILFTAAGFTRAVSLIRERRLAEPAAIMAPALALCLYLVLSNPRTIQAQYFDNLALVHLERGDTTAAVGELERELVFYPGQPQTLWALAYYLQKEGRDAEASRYLELLMARIGERQELLREAGLLDIRLGKTGRGVQRLARYLELFPQAPDSQRIAEYIGSLSGHDGGP